MISIIAMGARYFIAGLAAVGLAKFSEIFRPSSSTTENPTITAAINVMALGATALGAAWIVSKVFRNG